MHRRINPSRLLVLLAMGQAATFLTPASLPGSSGAQAQAAPRSQAATDPAVETAATVPPATSVRAREPLQAPSTAAQAELAQLGAPGTQPAPQQLATDDAALAQADVVAPTPGQLDTSTALPSAQLSEGAPAQSAESVLAPMPSGVPLAAEAAEPVEEKPAPAEATPAPARPVMQFYGVAMLYADYLSKDSTGGLGRLNAGTSGVGVRGWLDSEYGVAALYQIELGLALDATGIGPYPTSAFPLRNSAAGIEGAFGSLRFGNWDTPLKFQLIDIGPVRGLNPFDNPLRLNPGHGVLVTINDGGYTGSSTDAGFLRRQGNSVQYWTPNIAGFSARLAYSFNESKRVVDGARISPNLLSAALRYEYEGLSIRYGFEWHKDYFGLSRLASSAWEIAPTAPSSTNQGSSDMAHLGAVSFRFGGTRLSALVEYLSYSNDEKTEGAVESYGRLMGELYAEQNFGPHKVFGEVSMATEGSCELRGGGDCSAAGLGALAWAVGYVFALTPAASIYTVFQMIDNGDRARYATFPPVGAPPITPEGDDYISGGLGFIVLL